MINWRNHALMTKAKKNANYHCEECGSTEDIQAHHYNGKDNDNILVLCGKCHSAKHPELSSALFNNKKQGLPKQLWLDKGWYNSLEIYPYAKTWYCFGDILVDKEKYLANLCRSQRNTEKFG